MVREYVPMHGMGPASMRRPLALPLSSDSSQMHRVENSDIYRSSCETQRTAVRTNTAGRMQYHKTRSMVREYMPVQVSWPAPKRRPVARLSLTIHIIHVARHEGNPDVPTTLCRCTQRRSMVRDYVPAHASWPAPTRRRLARLSLTIYLVYIKRCGTQ